MSKSIVTLQLGNYSNFIGSHYWNLHEFSFENSCSDAINHDVNYYEGLTVNKNVTFTPKLISWDWKENLGPRIVDDIYEEIENQGISNGQSRRNINSLKVKSYHGKVEVNTGYSTEELSVNQSTKIQDKNYEQWNDYLYARLHPDSLTKLPKLYRDYESNNFKTFAQGLDLTKNAEYFDKMENQTRYFVEKCDFLQGFQMLCDVDDGFSGVGINFLHHLSDEYSRDIISFPTSNTNQIGGANMFNRISLFTAMNSLSVFWSPISVWNDNAPHLTLPNVEYDIQSKYQTSAILGLGLKSLLRPCFLTSNQFSLSDYHCVVDRKTNKLASIAVSMPFPMTDSLENTLLGTRPDQCFSVLNPLCRNINRVDSIVGNVFGLDDCRAKNAVRFASGPFDHCSDVADMMETFFHAHCGSQNVRFLSSPDSVRLGHPFPRFFSSADGDNRSLHCLRSMPLSTVLFANDNSGEFLSLICDTADQMLKCRRFDSTLRELESDILTQLIEDFRSMI